MRKNSKMSATTSNASSPETRSESRGSSVSTGLREEYEDLLRYAVVTPKIESLLPAKPTPKTSTKTHSAPPPPATLQPRPHTPPRHASRGRLQPECKKKFLQILDTKCNFFCTVHIML